MGRKILLADDSITIQKVVNLTFSDEGIDVVTVGNGELAIHKLEDVRPDLVLADIFMPGRNGYEVCGYIKDHPEFNRIPVLLLVGAFEPFDKNEAARVRADGHLTKPFESRALVATVKKLLDQIEPPKAVFTPPPPPPPPPVVNPYAPVEAPKPIYPAPPAVVPPAVFAPPPVPVAPPPITVPPAPIVDSGFQLGQEPPIATKPFGTSSPSALQQEPIGFSFDAGTPAAPPPVVTTPFGMEPLAPLGPVERGHIDDGKHPDLEPLTPTPAPAPPARSEAVLPVLDVPTLAQPPRVAYPEPSASQFETVKAPPTVPSPSSLHADDVVSYQSVDMQSPLELDYLDTAVSYESVRDPLLDTFADVAASTATVQGVFDPSVVETTALPGTEAAVVSSIPKPMAEAQPVVIPSGLEAPVAFSPLSTEPIWAAPETTPPTQPELPPTLEIASIPSFDQTPIEEPVEEISPVEYEPVAEAPSTLVFSSPPIAEASPIVEPEPLAEVLEAAPTLAPEAEVLELPPVETPEPPVVEAAPTFETPVEVAEPPVAEAVPLFEAPVPEPSPLFEAPVAETAPVFEPVEVAAPEAPVEMASEPLPEPVPAPLPPSMPVFELPGDDTEPVDTEFMPPELAAVVSGRKSEPVVEAPAPVVIEEQTPTPIGAAAPAVFELPPEPTEELPIVFEPPPAARTEPLAEIQPLEEAAAAEPTPTAVLEPATVPEFALAPEPVEAEETAQPSFVVTEPITEVSEPVVEAFRVEPPVEPEPVVEAAATESVVEAVEVAEPTEVSAQVYEAVTEPSFELPPPVVEQAEPVFELPPPPVETAELVAETEAVPHTIEEPAVTLESLPVSEPVEETVVEALVEPEPIAPEEFAAPVAEEAAVTLSETSVVEEVPVEAISVAEPEPVAEADSGLTAGVVAAVGATMLAAPLVTEAFSGGEAAEAVTEAQPVEEAPTPAVEEAPVEEVVMAETAAPAVAEAPVAPVIVAAEVTDISQISPSVIDQLVQRAVAAVPAAPVVTTEVTDISQISPVVIYQLTQRIAPAATPAPVAPVVTEVTDISQISPSVIEYIVQRAAPAPVAPVVTEVTDISQISQTVIDQLIQRMAAAAPPVAAAPVVTAEVTDIAQIPQAVVGQIVERVIVELSDRVVREIAWEVVPDLAELLIKQHLESGALKSSSR